MKDLQHTAKLLGITEQSLKKTHCAPGPILPRGTLYKNVGMPLTDFQEIYAKSVG